MKNVGNSSRWRSQGIPKIFRAPMYRAYCAVIFAIAQLSCLSLLLLVVVFFSMHTIAHYTAAGCQSSASHYLPVVLEFTCACSSTGQLTG